MTSKCPHLGLKNLTAPPGETQLDKHRARTRRRRKKSARLAPSSSPTSVREDTSAARLPEEADSDDVERGAIPDAVRTGRDVERE